MSFLLRVELPDVPGSLGRLATAIGEAGGDIEAIEIVEKDREQQTAVDDVLLICPPGTMPDSVVSACNQLDGVEVLWISRYAAASNLFLDLEVVEELTAQPEQAEYRLVELMPLAFRVNWAARVAPDGRLVQTTESTPDSVGYVALDSVARLDSDDESLVLAGAPFGDDIVLVARHGGPEFLDSELARLSHLIGLAQTISK